MSTSGIVGDGGLIAKLDSKDGMVSVEPSEVTESASAITADAVMYVVPVFDGSGTVPAFERPTTNLTCDPPSGFGVNVPSVAFQSPLALSLRRLNTPVPPWNALVH